MHDAAIAAWSCKGYYDYLRPVSAIRFMGDQGQSTEADSTGYSLFWTSIGSWLHRGHQTRRSLAGLHRSTPRENKSPLMEGA